jgi:sugar lactone lactonase YvrE
MPNDPAVAADGAVYLSDTRGSRIYRLGDDGLEVWLEGDEIRQPNGLHVAGGELLIGVNGDSTVKAADLDSGTLRTVAHLGAGIIDGVATDSEGRIIVSHWQGRVLRIESDGSITKLLDTTVVERQSADVEYVPELDLLAVPGFIDGRVTLYRVGDLPGDR